jgi:endonuclease/exonuclease/phosphatase family metal-dependent hydrolase
MKWLLCCGLLASISTCQRDDAPKALAIAENGVLSLKLATFNIRYENPAEQDWRSWPNRIGRMVRSLRTMNPDVFGVQECLHGQAADLRASLPDYDFHGVGRDDGNRAGEYAAIFFRRDRFERTDGGTFWLSDEPEKPGSKHWGNSYPRTVAWVRLVDRTTGRGFCVFNTHWDHRNQYSRERAAPLLARRMESRPHPHEPVVLLGDFNATEGNPAVDYFTGKPVKLAGTSLPRWEYPMTDTYQLLHPQVKNRRTLHFWQGHRDGWAKVDHILVSRGAKVLASDIRVERSREEQPSDHFPVWAEVEWP